MRRFKTQIVSFSGCFFFLSLLLFQVMSPHLTLFLAGLGCLGLYLFLLLGALKGWGSPLEHIMEMINSPKEHHTSDWILARWDHHKELTQTGLNLCAMIEKIRSQTELREQKDRDTAGILNSLNEGVIALNVSAQVTFVNQTACKILRKTESQLLRKCLSQMEPETGIFKQCHAVVLQALQTSEMTKVRWTAQELHFDLIASPLMHEEGAILVIQDKTLDYKVLEVGKNFIANASHELRTPITILLGFAEMLQNVAKLPPKTVLDISDKIIRTCDRLNNLIKSLLTIADLENLEKNRFRLSPLLPILENCKHLLLMRYPHAHLSIPQLSEDVKIYVDPDLFDLALMNLLENGVKYSGDPKRADLEIAVETKGEKVSLTVADRGVGIGKEDLPYIFDRFYRVDKARHKKSGGVGLGLSIVKTIVEKHGGKIEVFSESGKGSAFTLTLDGIGSV